MLEKLVYFISSFSLLFWTVFSNKKSLDESLAYIWVVTILLAVELVISIIWEKNRKKRQGIYIMLFLMNIGAAVSYCASNCRAFANDLKYLILIFTGVYFLTCYTDWYQSKNLGFLAMLSAPLALIGALFCNPIDFTAGCSALSNCYLLVFERAQQRISWRKGWKPFFQKCRFLMLYRSSLSSHSNVQRI